MEEEDDQTTTLVKFSGQPPPDAPGSSRRRRRQPQTWVAGFLCFLAISGQPIAPFHHFWTLSTHFRGPFLQIHHLLKDTAKTNSVDCWIKFSCHHNNLWTKARVLMCFWPLGLSIYMWFVNFEHRLVSFPFLGCFG